jgi:hypothetical protein
MDGLVLVQKKELNIVHKATNRCHELEMEAIRLLVDQSRARQCCHDALIRCTAAVIASMLRL